MGSGRGGGEDQGFDVTHPQEGKVWVCICGLPPSALPGISPSRGEIESRRGIAHHGRCESWRQCVLPISPLEGEMSGRREGGGRTLQQFHRPSHPIS